LKNVLTVDVEDYFHVEAFAAHVARDAWESYTPRVERNVDEVLALFHRHNARATFFMLGWVARRFPTLVRKIADAGHEIGCHSFGHQNIARQTREQFRADLRQARDLLVQQIQRPVTSYRAPSFSITRSTFWAIDILKEEGFVHDSSVFPVRHDVYGIPDAPRFPYRHENSLFEFPPSTIRRGNVNVGVGGGGYLRLAPYAFTRWAIRQINEVEKHPAMVYFHPWEIDPDQPRIRARLRSRLRHYTMLAGMKQKLDRLLQDFQFDTLGEVCHGLATTEYSPSLRYSSQIGR
jgi:polysaccharide deacetylase family protein (PEP-CTERM system associated)